jgi:hypothetical protein
MKSAFGIAVNLAQLPEKLRTNADQQPTMTYHIENDYRQSVAESVREQNDPVWARSRAGGTSDVGRTDIVRRAVA